MPTEQESLSSPPAAAEATASLMMTSIAIAATANTGSTDDQAEDFDLDDFNAIASAMVPD